MPNSNRRFSVLAVVLLAALAACQGSGATPSSPPSSTPAASPSPSPSPTTGPLDHPTEATEIVLRMEQTGGFVPQEFNATRLPAFTLYGDGTVIYAPAAPAFEPGAAREPMRVAKLTEDQVQLLLAFALERGRLLDARAHYPNPLVADAPSTVFSVNAAGVEKQVTIDALEEGEPTTTEDVTERRGFAELATRLATFSEAVEAGEVEDRGAYEPEAYAGILIEAPGMPGEMRDWPWPDLAPDDFKSAEEFGFRTAQLNPDQAAAVVDDPRGGVMSVGVVGPDRAPYTVNIRPLLPEELE
jgi:hypothetical protein